MEILFSGQITEPDYLQAQILQGGIPKSMRFFGAS